MKGKVLTMFLLNTGEKGGVHGNFQQSALEALFLILMLALELPRTFRAVALRFRDGQDR